LDLRLVEQISGGAVDGAEAAQQVVGGVRVDEPHSDGGKIDGGHRRVGQHQTARSHGERTVGQRNGYGAERVAFRPGRHDLGKRGVQPLPPRRVRLDRAQVVDEVGELWPLDAERTEFGRLPSRRKQTWQPSPEHADERVRDEHRLPGSLSSILVAGDRQPCRLGKPVEDGGVQRPVDLAVRETDGDQARKTGVGRKLGHGSGQHVGRSRCHGTGEIAAGDAPPGRVQRVGGDQDCGDRQRVVSHCRRPHHLWHRGRQCDNPVVGIDRYRPGDRPDREPLLFERAVRQQLSGDLSLASGDPPMARPATVVQHDVVAVGREGQRALNAARCADDDLTEAGQCEEQHGIQAVELGPYGDERVHVAEWQGDCRSAERCGRVG